MAKKFLTKEEVFVVKGYLSSDKAKVQPISNAKFIETQKHAEYVVALAEAAKGKDFKGKQADSFEDLKLEVYRALNKNSVKEYIEKPKEPTNTIGDKLKKEALDFIKYQDNLASSEKLNQFLSSFSIIDEFEEVGLFFDDEIVKINKIYTMEEVVKAVKSMADLL